jgi:alkanesulfonate monooxygenase SsuD/methylene tetrahydromethanopterin reductase-like flavin-dependent oxidoreductase (luciferase family)
MTTVNGGRSLPGASAANSPTQQKRYGFGVVGRDRPGMDHLAQTVEALGYDELWTNDWAADSRGASALGLVAAWSKATSRITLGVGVIPLSERTPAAIAQEVRRLELPLERVVIGVGSGTSGSLALVRDGVRELRSMLPTVVIAVAALGPKMCALAGEVADIVLPNWLIASAVPAFRKDVAIGSARAPRSLPTIAAYVRVTIGPDAEQRLRGEMERHRGSSSPVDALIRRQRVAPATVGVAAATPTDLTNQLAVYRRELDTCIVRGVPASDDVEAWLEIADWAAPGRATNEV